MKQAKGFKYCFLLCLSIFAVSVQAAETIQGKVQFVADTNVKMFRFKGSSDFESQIERSGNEIKKLEVRISPASLKTGMEIRDEHMRKRIFTGADGVVSDIVFKGTKSDCKPGEGSNEQKCEVNGLLSFRGQEHQAKLPLTLKEGAKVEGSLQIDVLEFGVAPELLNWTNVKVDPKVPVTFEAKIK
jgi:polyisoprenoid-binding protein YceI